MPTARELGIGIVAYRVLADGLLSGATAPSPGAHFVAPRGAEDGRDDLGRGRRRRGDAPVS
ncbi:hypothetical protein WMF00_07695 [Sorangium sp. So ce1182]